MNFLGPKTVKGMNLRNVVPAGLSRIWCICRDSSIHSINSKVTGEQFFYVVLTWMLKTGKTESVFGGGTEIKRETMPSSTRRTLDVAAHSDIKSVAMVKHFVGRAADGMQVSEQSIWTGTSHGTIHIWDVAV